MTIPIRGFELWRTEYEKWRIELRRASKANLIEHFVDGTTARCAGSLIGVNEKNGDVYFYRLREIIALHTADESQSAFDGETEPDESYLGGQGKGKRGRGTEGKAPVFYPFRAWRQGLEHP